MTDYTIDEQYNAFKDLVFKHDFFLIPHDEGKKFSTEEGWQKGVGAFHNENWIPENVMAHLKQGRTFGTMPHWQELAVVDIDIAKPFKRSEVNADPQIKETLKADWKKLPIKECQKILTSYVADIKQEFPDYVHGHFSGSGRGYHIWYRKKAEEKSFGKGNSIYGDIFDGNGQVVIYDAPNLVKFLGQQDKSITFKTLKKIGEELEIKVNKNGTQEFPTLEEEWGEGVRDKAGWHYYKRAIRENDFELKNQITEKLIKSGFSMTEAEKCFESASKYVERNPHDLDNATKVSDLEYNGWRQAMDTLGIQTRLNTRSQVIQVMGSRFPEWTDMTDAIAHSLRVEDMRYNFYAIGKEEQMLPLRIKDADWNAYLQTSASKNQIDPFERYLNELDLPELDEEKVLNYELCIDTMFEDLFGYVPSGDGIVSAEEDKLFTRYMSRMILLSAVHRTFKPGCKFDLAFVVAGQQGAGKDTFFKYLLPEIGNEPRFCNESFAFKGKTDKERVEATLGAVFVIASEMSGLKRTEDIEGLKQYITIQTDEIRLAYGKYKTKIPRRFIFVCTTNEMDEPLPTDPTGQRRWMVIKLHRRRALCRVEDWMEEHRDNLWATANALYNMNSNESSLQMPPDIADIQRRINIGIQQRDAQLEEAYLQCVEDKRIELKKPYAPALVARELGLIDDIDEWQKESKRHSYRLAEIMKLHGWHREQKKFDLTGQRIIVYYQPDMCDFSTADPEQARVGRKLK